MGVGHEMHQFAGELYPICRSITGDGVRETLRLLQKRIPLTINEVPTGTPIFDWTVPVEWNISDAYIKNVKGERIVDFKKSNLHILNYSAPIRARMSLAELRPHLFTLPDRPDWIPYRTSYYKENWGFCLSDRLLKQLPDGQYDVCIDSTLKAGSLSYGELHIPGASTDEIFISCHICHPSLCNDNLSGITVATWMAELCARERLRHTLRFVFVPGTIGSIAWLAQNKEHAECIKHGMVLTGVGDTGGFTYKRSRRGNAVIDRAMAQILRHSGRDYRIIDFFPYGYDERQYCSPGFNLPVGCLMRTPHGEYPEYHTSADNLDFIKPESLEDSLSTCLNAVSLVENNWTYRSLNPFCEPQLGKRGLYRAVGGDTKEPVNELAMLWVLNLSDGAQSLLDIAERANLSFDLIRTAAEQLHRHGLLERLGN
ncbi:peptidase M28 [Nitrospira sp. KM1]|nr:peptidase M28 [Nitrospira sp. KM1]